MAKSALPDEIRKLVLEHHHGGVSAEDCRACSSPCCSQGGFAILENVVEIYARYRQGRLVRPDFEFPQGLSLREFVFTYFDVYEYDAGSPEDPEPILFFHMRSLSPTNDPISIPAVESFWKVRSELFRANPWLNRGCVFLSHSVPNWPTDDGDSHRHCMLHESDSEERIGAKPIDCVFYTCERPIQAREPKAQTEAWFSALARAYPDSPERFRALLDDEERST